MCSLRVAPQGLVDLTPRGLRGEAIWGAGFALQVGGMNFAKKQSKTWVESLLSVF